MSTQKLTSRATSINAAKLPKVYGKIPAPAPGSLLLDYGCGRYTEHIRSAFPDVEYLPYDPYNQPEDVNKATQAAVRSARRKRVPVTVVCSNVLNVIDSPSEILSIMQRLAMIVLDTDGAAYITVYEGDRSGIWRQTGPDQCQRNEPLRKYLRFIPGILRKMARIERGMIVLECPKDDEEE